MLDVRLIANPSFTWAAVGFGLVSLVLTGAMFLLTQYLQDVLGYKPFDAGVRFTPLVLGLRIGAQLAMATGFGLLAQSLLLLSTASTSTRYSFIAFCLTITGAGLGAAMTPGLDSIMGAMPKGEFGAGSAVANAFRQVGGAIGVAMLGDIYLNRYVAKLHLPTALPLAVTHSARQSVGAANAVADKLGGSLGTQVRQVAHVAFMSGLDRTLVISAAIAIVAAALVAVFLPACTAHTV